MRLNPGPPVPLLIGRLLCFWVVVVLLCSQTPTIPWTVRAVHGWGGPYVFLKTLRMAQGGLVHHPGIILAAS